MRTRRCLTALAAGVLLLSSFAAGATPRRSQKIARVETPAPEPAVVSRPELTQAPAPPVERQRRWGLFGGGVALFAGGYALDIGLTYGIGHDPPALSLIPVIGPLIQLGDSWAMIPPAQTGNPQVDAQANPQIAQVNHTISSVAYAVLAVDFVLQLAGLTMAIVGAATTRPIGGYASRPSKTAWSWRGAGLAVTF